MDKLDRPKTKLSNDDLLALIHSYEKASLGSEVAAGATISTSIYPSNATLNTLQVQRYNALNAFFARPLGNEVENRSQVVMPVVRDTISWIMPQLMRMFVGTKAPCRFEAEGQQDESQAELETEAVNYVFMSQNDGEIILHDFFWDSLLMSNGYAQVYTREWDSVKEEKYTELDQIQLGLLLADKADEKIEVLEQREYQIDVPQVGPQGPTLVPVTVFDLRIRRTKHKKQTVVCCNPPEEMRVSPRARDGLENLPFTQHITLKTRSELIQDGFKRELIDSISKGRPAWLDIDALARDVVVDQLSIENPSDFSMQQVEVRTNIMMVDCDGDGVAELRRVIIAGDTIIENELIEETPFVSGQAIRMPHRHTGFSIYDLVMDLQVIQTTLLRAGLDNLTIANNLRIAVDWRNVNMDDLLTSRPHGPIRGNGPPGQWIEPIQMPTNVMSEVVPMLGYLDQLKTNRTGIGKGTMGLNADELQDVTKGAMLAQMSAAALIVELMARMLAEGVKGIFSKIRSELIRNQDKPMQMRLRGKWVEVDPSSWRGDRRVAPNVGLGSGNREELRANVQMLGQTQQAAGQLGLVGPKQVYESSKMMCEALGFSNPERFFMDPDSQEYQQAMQAKAQQAAQQQLPQVQVAQIKAKTELIKQQAENQRAAGEQQADMAQAKLQMIHEALQNAQAHVHEGLQGGGDRGLQILLTLIKSVAQIEAADKADPKNLGPDVNDAEGALQ